MCHPRPDQKGPWISRKCAVFIVFGLAIWSFYVVVGRVCTPMIREVSSSGIGRSPGAGTLAAFVVLWLMFIWTYLRIITTPPGFAKDRVNRSPPPDPADYPPPRSTSPVPVADNNNAPDPSTLAPTFNLASQTIHRWTSHNGSADTTRPSAPMVQMPPKGVKDWRQVPRPLPYVEYVPKWCSYCEIVKPSRTHHCRHCGTCVQQYDHHCVWVGQCVGWANHKFFVIFNFWTGCYCLFTMLLLIITASKTSGIDGQTVALVVVSGLFGLFTITMFITHVMLITSGRTTVESYASRDQLERENSLLQKEYGYLWHNLEKRKVRKRWKEEWGGTAVDERWKFGGKMDMWREEMGPGPLGWIFPIGKPLGDGQHYKSNPRFGPHGEWLLKKDWPLGVSV
ncbi:vacuolar protein [Cryptococcus wingfieldii CBS 7118]|uniref:Palmitoyltransferase n=1 Tax=Cryptococcus wingfieldii CBS 7118 TaxID=1295528 RepID=A0A1E3K6P2_9TREE|nr:vacuolar protein [Cryptococcus wingfieldii CBS 7118]ODO08533.1 vacuolar protein [Cryptococcus wingfieldii CBS 7118]